MSAEWLDKARYWFISATTDDLAYLFKLHQLTMLEHLKRAGLPLSDEDRYRRIQREHRNIYVIYWAQLSRFRHVGNHRTATNLS